MEVLLTGDLDSALVTYAVKKYTETSQIPLGRTILQKICYFVKWNKVPLRYEFEIYHYGPFSQDLYFDIELLKADEFINDTSSAEGHSNYIVGGKAEFILEKYQKEIKIYKKKIDEIVDLFKLIKPVDFELYATIHYLCESFSNFYKKPLKLPKLIEKFKEIKGNKFTDDKIKFAYSQLTTVGLIPK